MSVHPPCILHGPRVLVRMGEATDACAIARFYRDNDDFIARTQNRARSEFLAEPAVRATLTARRVDYEQDRACNLFTFDRASGELLGAINLTNFVRGYFQACYLGYALAERAEGRGLMFESLSLVLPFAFEKLRLHRIMANHTPDNERSGALLRRLGFRVEGLAPRYIRIHGEWRDHVLTALDAEDFQKNHQGRLPLP